MKMKKFLAGFSAVALMLAVATPVAALTAEERAASREQAKTRAQEKRGTSQARTEEIKQEVAARKLELQQQRCERYETRLRSALPRLSNGATRVKGNVDKVYERVQGFYEKGQLTVGNYDEQIAAIELAKANAETALEVLSEYEFEVDCANQKVGSQLDGYRSAVKAARKEIKAYHKDVVGLVKSLRAEAAEQNAESKDDKESDETNSGDVEATETESN